ncbi:3-phosphoshikimate 1-carboxyvinyltransferase [Alicycliphilus sp. B1]|nr:3-phosphoshikimate 1-carboxyvinyltransferase [Alicycliphilus sp. B1]
MATRATPLSIQHAAGLPALRLHEPIRVRGDVSSQFLTALLMALPLVAKEQDVVIEVVGELISRPYIHITLELLARFGIAVRHEEWQRFTIPPAAAIARPARSTWRPTPLPLAIS